VTPMTKLHYFKCDRCQIIEPALISKPRPKGWIYRPTHGEAGDDLCARCARGDPLPAPDRAERSPALLVGLLGFAIAFWALLACLTHS